MCESAQHGRLTLVTPTQKRMQLPKVLLLREGDSEDQAPWFPLRGGKINVKNVLIEFQAALVKVQDPTDGTFVVLDRDPQTGLSLTEFEAGRTYRVRTTPQAGLADRYAGDATEHSGPASRQQAGGLVNIPRGATIQRLAAQTSQDPDFRWKEADRLLVETFQRALNAQLERSRAPAPPPNEVSSDDVTAIGSSFPFVQREREVRAFVEDLHKLHVHHCKENRSADIESPPPASDFSAEYSRAAHLQLFLGPPGVGKTTLLRNLGRCIIKELDASPDWLHGSDSFWESLKSSLGAPIPFVFELDLYEHVANQFEDQLMQSLGGKPATLLALLMLMCVARAIIPNLPGLAALVDRLPDELLAILQPEHVARFVHTHFPHSSNVPSTQIYAFDEASSLGRRARRFVRAALGNVLPSKKGLPTPIFYTIVLLSTRWGRMPGRLHLTPASPQAPGTGGTDKSDAASASPLQGGRPAAALHTPAPAPLQEDKEESDLALQPTPSGATAAKAVHLQLLTDNNMRLIFMAALESLGIQQVELPPHVCLLLDLVNGIARHAGFVFAAVALSKEHDRFSKRALIDGLSSHTARPSMLRHMYERLRSFMIDRMFCKNGVDKLESRTPFRRVFRRAALMALANRAIAEHDPVVAEDVLSYSNLQAYGLITLQALPCELLRVVMSPVVLDAWITWQGGELMPILKSLPLVSGAPVAGNPGQKEVLDLRSWIALLAITRELGPAEVSVREILSLSAADVGPAFDVTLNLSELNFEARELHEHPTESQMAAWLTSGSLKLATTGEDVKVDFYLAAKGAPRPDWGSRLPTMVADMPVLHGQGQSKQLAEDNRGAPSDGGLELICREADKMYAQGRNHSFLILVSDQELTAKHGMPNVAVLSRQADHSLYSPLMRFLEVLESIEKRSRDVNVPVPPGVKVKDFRKQKAAENEQRRQDRDAGVANGAEAKQAAQPQPKAKKSGNEGNKKLARDQAAACESGDAAKPAKNAKGERS
ncbi:g6935 [Coccomyxa elongata]